MAGTLRVGRLALTPGSAGVTATESGNGLSLSGEVCADHVPGFTALSKTQRLRAMAILKHSIAGLSDGLEEVIAVAGNPTTNDWDPSLDGLYRCTSSSADLGPDTLEHKMPFSIDLERVDHRPLMETTLAATSPSNPWGYTGRAVHALPAAAASNRLANFGWPAAVPQPITPSWPQPIGSGSWTVAWSQTLAMPPSGIARDTWTCPPDAWYIGAARLAIPHVVGSTLIDVPIVGKRWPGWLDWRQADSATVPQFVIDNGLIRLGVVIVSGQVRFRLWCWTGGLLGAWKGPFGFTPMTVRAGAGTPWNRVAAVRIVRNDPAEVCVEIDLARTSGLAGPDALADRRHTMAIRMQRGRHIARIERRSEAAEQMRISRDGSDPATLIDSATMRDTSSSLGFWWAMTCDVAHTTNLTLGNKQTSAAVNRSGWGIGAVPPSTLGDTRPTMAEVRNQFWTDTHETVRLTQAVR